MSFDNFPVEFCAMTSMRIVSWNINGIRTFKKGIGKILEDLDADIACFQETKINSKRPLT